MNDTGVPAWPAPTATASVRATVVVPGSKSLTNRALVLASLSTGPSRIKGPLRARDTELMADALRALGATIQAHNDEWSITPADFRGGGQVDCGLAGTVMRFVPPLAALADGAVGFDGDPQARRRPMAVVIDALRTLGVSILDDNRGGLPFTIQGTGHVRGGAVTIDASASSQFVSGLLLAGARYEQGLTVHHDGEAVPSVPHIVMTVAMLRACGVQVDDSEANTWRVAAGPIRAPDVTIEPDLSNAAPFLAAALVTGGEVRIPRWPADTDQPGGLLRELLTQMGGECTLNHEGLTVRGTGRVHGIDADLHDASELTPVLAALAALAEGPSRLRGIAHIRGHETDRLAALSTELSALGGSVTETADGLAIRPATLHGGLFHTYADHRMAQAGALLGLSVPGVEVDDIATTAKTMPQFVTVWTAMLGGERAA